MNEAPKETIRTILIPQEAFISNASLQAAVQTEVDLLCQEAKNQANISFVDGIVQWSPTGKMELIEKPNLLYEALGLHNRYTKQPLDSEAITRARQPIDHFAGRRFLHISLNCLAPYYNNELCILPVFHPFVKIGSVSPSTLAYQQCCNWLTPWPLHVSVHFEKFCPPTVGGETMITLHFRKRKQ